MIWIYDEETISNCFVVCFKNVLNGDKKSFVIWKDINQLNELLDFLKEVKLEIGFNNLGFDAQIQQRIIEGKIKAAEQIYDYAQKLITSEDKWKPYAEWKLSIPQMDLFLIWHFNNEAKSTSLKWLQFMMDWHDVREMNIHHSDSVETQEQLDEIISYCFNDIDSTEALFRVTKGLTDLPLYKGIDKINLRINVQEEFKIKCANYNDVKIGETIMKNSYMEAEGIDNTQLYAIHKVKSRFTFGDCFPEYYSFKSKPFNEFISKIQDVVCTQDEKQKFNLTIGELSLTIAKGGLHSEDDARMFKSNSMYIIRDADVGSMYPNAIRKRKLHPRHLSINWLNSYTGVIKSRIDAKKKFKETKDGKYKAIDETYKLALNGGSFGKMGEPTNWQYDLFSLNQVTIGSQIDLLMLIEEFLLNDIYIISVNTDGVLCYLERDKEELYYKICKEWEVKVGNDELGNLEFVDYELFAQTSVNDYIAIKSDNSVKTKGDFMYDFELHKNKSRRVVPLALKEYFQNNTPIEKFIKQHTNIFDFCCAVRAKSDASLYLRDIITGEEEKQQKTVRYYISNSNTFLIKRMKPLARKVKTYQLDIFGGIDDGTRENQVEAGFYIDVLNKYEDKTWNINYNYYIKKANDIIKQIEIINFNQRKLL